MTDPITGRDLDQQPCGCNVYRHCCAHCQHCDGDNTQLCAWGSEQTGTAAHIYATCPGRTCGQPWPGCHHCGAPIPCPEPCWHTPRDGDGNPLMFTDQEVTRVAQPR